MLKWQLDFNPIYFHHFLWKLKLNCWTRKILLQLCYTKCLHLSFHSIHTLCSTMIDFVDYRFQTITILFPCRRSWQKCCGVQQGYGASDGHLERSHKEGQQCHLPSYRGTILTTKIKIKKFDLNSNFYKRMCFSFLPFPSYDRVCSSFCEFCDHEN